MIEYNEQELTEDLRKRLDNLGNKDASITKTMLWQYSLDKKEANRMGEELNSEMNRAKFARNIGEIFFANNLGAQKEIMNLVRSSSFTEETYFSRGGVGHNFFYSTPPVKDFYKEDRILVSGTNAEVNELSHIIEALKQGKRLNPPRRKISQQIAQELEKNKVNYCSKVGHFWQYFFDEDNFLDKKVSSPKKIIATGYMRNYSFGAGETIDVRSRLSEIAQQFETNIEFISPFHI